MGSTRPPSRRSGSSGAAKYQAPSCQWSKATSPTARRRVHQAAGSPNDTTTNGANHDGIGAGVHAIQPKAASQTAKTDTDSATHAASNARSRGANRRVKPKAVATRGDGTAPAQMRRNTREPFVPPKPKLFFTATLMRISRA